jgi:predicted methyltransferase
MPLQSRIANWLALIAIMLAVPIQLAAQEESVKPGINKSFEDPDVPRFIGLFEREGRDAFDHRHEIIAACGLQPGMKIADVGAGTGLFTRMFAGEVGVDGKVYAVDISEKFLKHVEETSAADKLTNVILVQCTPDSVNLPPESVDLVFICDTYHHFEFPFKTMRTIHNALRQGGAVVLVDFERIEGKSAPFIMGHVRAGKEVFTKEIRESGFRQVEEKEGMLDESYFVRFEKIDLRVPPETAPDNVDE